MRKQIQVWVSTWSVCQWGKVRQQMAGLQNYPLWQDGMMRLAGIWKRVSKWWMAVGLLVLILGMLLAGRSAVSSTTPPADDGLVLEEKAVLCIGVVRYSNGMQDAFFQRPDESVEETLMAQSNAELVAQGFTVEHRDCYASWQAAADFLTDGRVTLPDNATEQDFTAALMGWKQQQMMGGQ